MGKVNKYNYYSFQDLSFAEPLVEKMLGKNKKIGTIYSFLRKEARWDTIGDYPLLFFICLIAGKKSRIITAKEITKVLKKTEEFKNIRQNNQLIAQVCAAIIAQNANRGKGKTEADESFDISGEGKLRN